VLVVTLAAVSTPSNFFAPAAGGPIVVERVDYLENGVLDQGDYSFAAVGSPVVAIDGATLGQYPVTITGIVQSVLASPPATLPGLQPYLGLRFYWAATAAGVENTDRSGDNDIATLGMMPTLTVSYGN
jgi:hypothetical protein